MGSKNRFAKELLEIVLADRGKYQAYVEPFAGGMNTIDKVTGWRIASDSHCPLISMWKALIYNSWTPPEYVTKEEYDNVRTNPDNYSQHYLGWVGFNCSYRGKWFGGYAGKCKTNINTERNYQSESIRNVTKQIPKLVGVDFRCVDYTQLLLPRNSLVYCDPPYFDTTKYRDDVEHERFWNWVRKISKEHNVFVSEYVAPPDFKCVWSKEVASSLSRNGTSGGNRLSVERLYKFIG